jgi:hypothetical protein
MSLMLLRDAIAFFFQFLIGTHLRICLALCNKGLFDTKLVFNGGKLFFGNSHVSALLSSFYKTCSRQRNTRVPRNFYAGKGEETHGLKITGGVVSQSMGTDS